MRLNYSDDENFPGQFDLWNANCMRSLRGKNGQAELRELEMALLALPEKRLIKDALQDDQGGVCAIACYAKHKGTNIPKSDGPSLSILEFEYPYNDSCRIGVESGMPRLVAWKVVALNDLELKSVTPEKRYEKVLAWVREQLR